MPTMSLPPEAKYGSLNALYEAAQLHALHHGYAFVKRRSKQVNASGRKKWYIDCDRHNYTTTKQHRERRTNSRGNGCQFSIFAIESSDRLTWQLKHRPGLECGTHNHPPSQHPSAHPVHRKLARKDQIIVQELAQAG